jgi:hypothetical protein
MLRGRRSRMGLLNRNLDVLRLVLTGSREAVVTRERVNALWNVRETGTGGDSVRVLAELNWVASGQDSRNALKREALTRCSLSLRVELLLKGDVLSELVDTLLLRHSVLTEVLSHSRLRLREEVVRVSDRGEGEGVRGLLLLLLLLIRKFRILVVRRGTTERRRLRGVGGFRRFTGSR